MFKKKILKYGLIYSILASIFYMIYSNMNMNYFEYFELKTYDLRYKIKELFPEKKREFDVAIIGIDEKSIIDIGKWPWKRSVHAQLLNELNNYDTKAIGFDVSFTEFGVDKNILSVKENLKNTIGQNYYNGNISEELAINLLEELNKIKTDEDYEFAEALKKNGKTIIGTYNVLDEKEKIESSVWKNDKYLDYRYNVNSVISEVLKSSRSNEKSFKPFTVYKIIPPIDIISNSANGIAPFEVGYPDPDGVLRGVALVTEETSSNVYFPTLYLLTFLKSYNFYIDKNVTLDFNSGNIEILDNENKLFRKIPTNKNGYQRLYFYGKKNSFKYYSYVDILNKKIPKEALKDKILLVGYTDTAKGLYDLRSTPLDPNLPGVEIHATAIQNLIDNKFMVRADILGNILFILIINILIVIFMSMEKLSIKKSNLLILTVIASSLIVNFILFWNGKWYELFYPFTTYFLNYLIFSIKKYFDEEIEKKYIREVFSHYISPKLVEELIQNPEMVKLGGEKKELTCFFSDIAGFTTISEKLQPEELVSLLNEYLSRMSNIIMENRGTIDKYIGDAIMGIFGAPVDSENNAKDACVAALSYQKDLEKLREEKNVKLFARIGINTGEMIVGNMGCSIGEIKRFDYTVIGDEVNLASRLEGINKYYGTNIIISENTYEKVKNDFEVRPLDFVKVKGKNKAVMIFQLIDFKNNIDDIQRKKLDIHLKALENYKNRNWEEAKKLFNELIESSDDYIAKQYIERIDVYEQSPPPNDWDYSYTFTSK